VVAATASLKDLQLVPERPRINASIRRQTFEWLDRNGYSYIPYGVAEGDEGLSLFQPRYPHGLPQQSPGARRRCFSLGSRLSFYSEQQVLSVTLITTILTLNSEGCTLAAVWDGTIKVLC